MSNNQIILILICDCKKDVAPPIFLQWITEIDHQTFYTENNCLFKQNMTLCSPAIIADRLLTICLASNCTD